MKHASLLIVLCALFGFSSFAQSTTTVEKSAKRITVTTKKVDENGKTITETYIAEGDEPVKILEGMAVNPEIIQRVDVENTSKVEGEERLFLLRRASDGTTIEGTLNENVNNDLEEQRVYEKVIIIDHAKEGKECYKFLTTNGDHPRMFARSHETKGNCAALGVYVTHSDESNGSLISSLIESGGAQAAGMKEGDVITKIAEYDVTDFSTLHKALSNFRPGDVVTVRFDRNGKSHKAKVELKDWKDLPGHEWRARTDCGQTTMVEEPVVEEAVIDEPSIVKPLELQDVSIYPNPTEGIVAVGFKVEPGPIAIAITDVSGKVVYQENNENPDGTYRREIDLKDLVPGNYVISVTQGDKVYTGQIAKQ